MNDIYSFLVCPKQKHTMLGGEWVSRNVVGKEVRLGDFGETDWTNTQTLESNDIFTCGVVQGRAFVKDMRTGYTFIAETHLPLLKDALAFYPVMGNYLQDIAIDGVIIRQGERFVANLIDLDERVVSALKRNNVTVLKVQEV